MMISGVEKFDGRKIKSVVIKRIGDEYRWKVYFVHQRGKGNWLYPLDTFYTKEQAIDDFRQVALNGWL